jgi:hypothetical protein
LRHGLMCRPTRSKPIAVKGERRIPLLLQNLHHRLLDEAILTALNPFETRLYFAPGWNRSP